MADETMTVGDAVVLLTERLPGMEAMAEEYNSPYGRTQARAIRVVLDALAERAKDGHEDTCARRWTVCNCGAVSPVSERGER